MSALNRAARLLLCPNCTAPIDVSPDGGTAHCDYCHRASQWDPRGDMAVPRGAVLDEADRLERLRRQVGREEPIPPEVLPFIAGAAKPEVRAEARKAWAEARSAGDETLLYYLTIALYNGYSGPEHAREQRAFLESAVETLYRPRFRQLLYSMMTRNAARAGNLSGADEWGVLLDPHSADLPSDSSYRMTWAYVATARGTFREVFKTVGTHAGEVSLYGSDVFISLTLRANAYERLGDVDAAVRELLQTLATQPTMVGLVGRIIEANPTLGLCTASYPRVVAELG